MPLTLTCFFDVGTHLEILSRNCNYSKASGTPLDILRSLTNRKCYEIQWLCGELCHSHRYDRLRENLLLLLHNTYIVFHNAQKLGRDFSNELHDSSCLLFHAILSDYFLISWQHMRVVWRGLVRVVQDFGVCVSNLFHRDVLRDIGLLLLRLWHDLLYDIGEPFRSVRSYGSNNNRNLPEEDALSVSVDTSYYIPLSAPYSCAPFNNMGNR